MPTPKGPPPPPHTHPAIKLTKISKVGVHVLAANETHAWYPTRSHLLVHAEEKPVVLFYSKGMRTHRATVACFCPPAFHSIFVIAVIRAFCRSDDMGVSILQTKQPIGTQPSYQTHHVWRQIDKLSHVFSRSVSIWVQPMVYLYCCIWDIQNCDNVVIQK